MRLGNKLRVEKQKMLERGYQLKESKSNCDKNFIDCNKDKVKVNNKNIKFNVKNLKETYEEHLKFNK